MLFGEFEHQVDARNRIRIPYKFKDELGASYVFCLAEKDIISVYNEKVALEKFGKLYKASPFSRRAAKMALNFMGGLYNAEDDGQGRVIIPEPLRKKVDLGRDIVSMGAGDHVEIMSVSKREEIRALENEPDYYDVLNELYSADENK